MSCAFLVWKDVILSVADFPKDFAAVFRETFASDEPAREVAVSSVDLEALFVGDEVWG